MIKSFKHAGLEKFYRTGSKAGIQPVHANRLRELLGALQEAAHPDDLMAPSYRTHPLKHDRAGEWSMTVQAGWRITFRFDDGNTILLNYENYH